MARKEENIWPTVGAWAFYAGLAIAVLAGFFASLATPGTLALLGVLGVIVGLLNISDKEAQLFLLASIGLLVAANGAAAVVDSLGAAGIGLGNFIPAILRYIVVFVAPAAALVSLRAIYDVARKG